MVEAKLDRGWGLAWLRRSGRAPSPRGDVVTGQYYGKVRRCSTTGASVKETAALPILLEDVAIAGHLLRRRAVPVDEERKARQIALMRHEQEKKVAVSACVTLADLHKQIEAGEVKELRVILKGDVDGSVEALQDALERVSKQKRSRSAAIHSAVGTITETDVMLASASNAIVIGFNGSPSPRRCSRLRRSAWTSRATTSSTRAINDVKAALAGMLPPIVREVPLGKAQVRAPSP